MRVIIVVEILATPGIDIFSHLIINTHFSANDFLCALSTSGAIDIFINIIVIIEYFIHHFEDIFERNIFTPPMTV